MLRLPASRVYRWAKPRMTLNIVDVLRAFSWVLIEQLHDKVCQNIVNLVCLAASQLPEVRLALYTITITQLKIFLN